MERSRSKAEDVEFSTGGDGRGVEARMVTEAETAMCKVQTQTLTNWLTKRLWAGDFAAQ